MRIMVWLVMSSIMGIIGWSSVGYAVDSSVISNAARKADWTKAGVNGGIVHRTTQCGATVNAYSGTAGTINTAISNCASGQFVQLGTGTFNISTMITFGSKNNVTLRGMGANNTIIVFGSGAADGCGGPLSLVCVEGPYINVEGTPQNIRNWTAGYASGTTVITLAAVTNLQVGSQMILDQTGDAADTGSVFINCAAAFTDEGGCSPQDARGRPQNQHVVVTAINGTNVTITPPLHMPNWSSGKNPQAIYNSMLPRTGIGIENLSLDGSAPSGYWAIVTFFGAVNSWVSGVRIDDPQRAHVLCYQGSRISVVNNLMYDGQAIHSQSYGFETYGCGSALVENNIFRLRTSPISLNGPGSGHVIAYNYIDAQPWDSPTNWQPESVLYHEAGLSHILVEGNDVGTLVHDDIHGTTHFNTHLRNLVRGESGKTAHSCSVSLASYGRYFNHIGNVMGRSGLHTVYEPSGTTGEANNQIYCFGWSPQSPVPNDPKVKSTFFRWGNYDIVTNTNRFMTGEVPTGDANYPTNIPSTNTVPSSLYLNAKPSWFGSIPWPPIGPEVTGGNVSGYGGRAYKIPARVCWESLAGPSSFNAATCFGGGSSDLTPPAIPTGLTIF
jgi:hypothetical protein